MSHLLWLDQERLNRIKYMFPKPLGVARADDRKVCPTSGKLGQNRAILASMIETCKLNPVDPHAWLIRTLTAIANGHKQSNISSLMP